MRSPLIVVVLVASGFAQMPSRVTDLVSAHDCVACHRADDAVVKSLQSRTAPDLASVGARVTPQYLRRYLEDPHGTHPGTTMPDLLGRLSERERAEAIDGLLHYLVSLGGPLAQEPVGVTQGTMERGRQLFHSVGCFACHEPREEVWELEYPHWRKDEITDDEREFHAQAGEPFLPKGTMDPPDLPLPDLARKTTVPALAGFLRDPLKVRPGGRMPSLQLTTAESKALAVYLLEGQLQQHDAPAQGLRYEYFEYRNAQDAPVLDGLEAKRTGIVDVFKLPEHRPDHFGFRFTGTIEIPEDGSWRFFTVSDDGSRLFIDGKLVVKNDGKHGMKEESGEIELGAGRHAIMATFYEFGGGEGLRVLWEGPGTKKQAIPAGRLTHMSQAYVPTDAAPFTVDQKKALVGRALFEKIGCRSCHRVGSQEAEPSLSGPPLMDLVGKSGGCLADVQSGKAPRLNLGAADREALRAGMGHVTSLAEPTTSSQRTDATMRRLHCYACHRRDQLGGPHPLRKDYYDLLVEADVGDEGRVPPELTGVGRKLHRSWLEGVLLEGRRAHSFMAARMPDFGQDNVRHLVEDFIASDRKEEPAAPPFSKEIAEQGRRLVGIKGGLGCIRCHTFDGRDSLGIPAVDLAPMSKRLQWGFFHDLLLDPNSVNMDTRMPKFWEDGKSAAKDILGGDPRRQIEAMWTYLSLGSAMPLPDGLITKPGTYDLVPSGRVITVGVFMKGVSPRTVMVGTRDRVHWAFDAQNSRMAKLWSGSFFNARGTWHARAGALESPPGKNALDLPPGSPIAALEKEDSPWPKEKGTAAGLRPMGRHVAADGRPTFRYRFGPMTVSESGQPEISKAGPSFVRRLVFEAAEYPGEVWFRAAVGRTVDKLGPGRFRVEGGRPHTIALPPDLECVVVQTTDGSEVRVPVKFGGFPGSRVIAYEIAW